MHPLTRFFNCLKRNDFAVAVARDHLSDRDLARWYPGWMYEFMETDAVRNAAYEEVIRDTVSGKIVLEVGAGPRALWAVCCARAGAKQVYAIEANQKACESAREFVRSQGIENVHLICGFSDQIELPERCEVLVHSIVGDIGSCEGMIGFVEDAKRRLLTPDAVHIPQRATTYAVIAEDPRLRPAEWALSFALRGLRRFEGLSFVWFFGFPHAAALSEPQVFEDLVFGEAPELNNNRRLVMEVERDGLLRGVCFFIRVYVSKTRVVDSWASKTAWSTPYIRLKAPTRVRRGDRVEMSVQSDLSGNPSYAISLRHQTNGGMNEIGEYAWSGD